MNHSSRALLCLFFLFFVQPRSQGTELILSSAHDHAMTPCMDEADCDTLKHGTCVDNFCQCNGSRFCEDKVEIKVTKLGEMCKINADCNIEHSVCKEGKCNCEEERVGNMDGRRCLKVADGLGGTCEDSIQCYTKVPHSGCQNEKCVCQQKTHAYSGRCYEDVGLGQKCSQLGDCTKIPFTRCKEEKCICKVGYVPSAAQNKCLEIARRINDSCYEDIQCAAKFGMAVCKQGFCNCVELFQYKKIKDMCVRDLLLGEVCENHTDCHGIEEGESRLECILGECKCKSDYIEGVGFCASSASYLVHTPSVLLLIVIFVCGYFNDNIYVLWCSLVYSVFYILWITFLGRYFFDNNNYLEPRASHED